MDKPVNAFHAYYQLQTHRLPQIRVDLVLRAPVNDRKCRDLGAVAHAGKLLQYSLRFHRQASQLSHHQVHHIVGVTLSVNATQIEGPSRRIMIEGEQAIFRERSDELKSKKRIATRLVVHQLRVLRLKIRYWRLVSNDEFQFRHQIHNEQSVRI